MPPGSPPVAPSDATVQCQGTREPAAEHMSYLQPRGAGAEGQAGPAGSSVTLDPTEQIHPTWALTAARGPSTLKQTREAEAGLR